jgi:anti-sigma B factor antagonist
VFEECELDSAPADPGPPAERCPTVRMPAEIDIANADDLRQSLTAAVDQGFAVVIADMSDTLFCDCAAVTALVVAAQYAAAAGAELRVVATARPVLRTFELTGVAALLAVFPSAEAAASGSAEAETRYAGFRSVTRLSSRRQTDFGRSGPQQRQPRSP